VPDRMQMDNDKGSVAIRSGPVIIDLT
jgi:hypothetical protein